MLHLLGPEYYFVIRNSKIWLICYNLIFFSVFNLKSFCFACFYWFVWYIFAVLNHFHYWKTDENSFQLRSYCSLTKLLQSEISWKRKQEKLLLKIFHTSPRIFLSTNSKKTFTKNSQHFCPFLWLSFFCWFLLFFVICLLFF